MLALMLAALLWRGGLLAPAPQVCQYKEPDLNGNGAVDAVDLAWMARVFGYTPTQAGSRTFIPWIDPLEALHADLNWDGTVNAIDLAYFARYFGGPARGACRF